jgi:RNA-directed DNA polymerase
MGTGGGPEEHLREDHDWVLRFVEHRVGDPRLIDLIRRWLKAGVLEDGAVQPSEEDLAKGGLLSAQQSI